MKPRKDPSEKPWIELCEEAAFLLRRAPAAAWTIYFLGTGPFLLALLHFWTDMTRGVFHEARLVSGSFALALLFIWMKTCHAMFASRLWSVLSTSPREQEDFRAWWNVALAQTRIQPWSFIALFSASLIMAPFAWVFAYFQNVTALGSARGRENQSLHDAALHQARLWPKQNHAALGATMLLSSIIFFDILIVLALAPQLLITFLGVKEIFRPNAWLLLNTTFLALVGSLTYLMVDPLIKSLYTLRCYYGESLATGEDLRARLLLAKRLRKPAASIPRIGKTAALLCLVLTTAPAAEPPPPATPAQLDQSISETMESSEYNWRFPREIVERERTGWIYDFFTGIGNWIEATVRWIGSWFEELLRWVFQRGQRNKDTGLGFWIWPNVRDLLLLFALVIVVVLLVLYFQRRRRPVAAIMSAKPAVAIPDITDENVAADQLPDDEWLKMASQLAGQGDLRLAIRALFLSALASMAGRNWIVLALFKSNRDYEREFRRRAASIPGAAAAFVDLVAIYNRIWYGLHEPTPDMLARCEENVRMLRQ